MNSAQPETAKKLLTLKETARILAVSVDTLIEWNDSNILKPTITQSGQIVYAEEQINKFLSIQQLIRDSLARNKNGEISEHNQNFRAGPPENVLSQNKVESAEFSTNPDTLSAPAEDEGQTAQVYAPEKNDLQSVGEFSKTVSKNSFKLNRIYSFFAISSISCIVVLAAFFMLQRQDKFKLLNGLDSAASPGKSAKVGISSETQLVGVKFLKFALPDFIVPSKNQNYSDNGIKNTDTAFPENKLAAPILIFDKGTTTDADNNDQTITQLLGFETQKENRDYNATDTNYAGTANFASRPNLPTGSPATDTVFDENGNIKGEAKTTNLLSTSLETSKSWSNVPLKQAIDQNIILAFLTLGFLSVVFVFKKQPDYSVNMESALQGVSPVFAEDARNQKILEIGQKTDGTVVLYFRGVECKVSKPELNSESDQFIERLLGYAKDDSKEIYYDILKDKKIRFYAPLSKLVTRLGFVGLKRELFFPRTSKNRVLFRKYVTQEDLTSMGLTIDKISGELIN